MSLYRLIITLVILLGLVGPAVTKAQSSPRPTRTLNIAAQGTYYSIGDNNGDVWEAQSFTDLTGVLSSLSITLAENIGNPTGTITWQLQTDAEGQPSGTVLAAGVFDPVPSAENQIPVANGPTLKAAATYWLVLKSTVPQPYLNYWSWQCSPTDVYPHGSLAYTGSGGYEWEVQSEVDTQFSVTVDELLDDAQPLD